MSGFAQFLAAGLEPEGGPVLSNLRGHLMKGGLRFLLLASLDVGVIWLGRQLLRATRDGLLGPTVGSFTQTVLPSGAVSAPQITVAILLSLLFLGAYRAGHRWRDPVRIITGAGIGVILALYSDVWHQPPTAVMRQGVLIWAALGPLLAIGRTASSYGTRRFARGAMSHKVLEVTAGPDIGPAVDLGPAYNVIASLRADSLPENVEGLERWLEGGVDTIVVRGHMAPADFRTLTDFALTHGCRLLCSPRGSRLLGVDMRRVWMEGQPMLELTAPGLRASQLVLKRALDIAGSVVLLALFSPLLGVVALWIKMDSAGPALFAQRRPGFQGRSFPMFKFRSMRADAEAVLKRDPDLYRLFLANDCKLPEDVDPRLTRAGRFIRKTSIDELPQLLNVLRGEMSLVGPRPLVGPEIENYQGRIPTLLSVKPGMTGHWQVSGRSAIGYPERAEMDLDYVRRWSLLRDLWILLLTPAAVLIRRGAH